MDLAEKAADHVHLKLAVPTGQRTMESYELIPCFACPCLGMYCSPHHKCGCAANNQCFCLSCKMKEYIKLFKCGKEEDTLSISIFNFTFVLKKPAPKFAIAFESWTPKNRDILLATGEVGCFEFTIELADGCGCYRPGCNKPFCCCKCQNKCCCCVQQSALPYDSQQACACFGLACLPGMGCCKTVGHMTGKVEMHETKDMRNGGSPKSSKKKKKKKAKLSPGIDKDFML